MFRNIYLGISDEVVKIELINGYVFDVYYVDADGRRESNRPMIRKFKSIKELTEAEVVDKKEIFPDGYYVEDL